MKNENGSGSVYKLSGKRRKPWVATVTTGYENGKQKRKIVGTAETKREAQELLYKYLKNPLLFSKKTFKDIRLAWFEEYLKKGVAKGTLYNIESKFKNLSSLDNYIISDIRLLILQNFIDNLKVSYGTKNGYKSILNMIFDFALKNDFITSNKVNFIEIGKKETVIERMPFSQEEINVLWENVNITYVDTILILLYTGMRISELLSLKNKDIDLENRIIHIRESKTEAGIRDIPIHHKIFNLFINRISLENTYFIKAEKSQKLSYTIYRKKFVNTLKTLGIREHTIHDTRHTTATLLNNADANRTAIKKMMGHTKYALTENVYTHKDVEELRKAVELIN